MNPIIAQEHLHQTVIKNKMKIISFNKLKTTRTLVVILLFLSSYVILIDTNSEKFIPLPYFLIEFGAVFEIFSNGFNKENTKDYLIFFATIIAHANILFLMIERTFKWLSILLPLVFILLLLSNNPNSLSNYSNIAMISIIPYFVFWLLLIMVCFRNNKEY